MVDVSILSDAPLAAQCKFLILDEKESRVFDHALHISKGAGYLARKLSGANFPAFPETIAAALLPSPFV